MKLFRDVYQFWKDTWKESKALFIAEALGTTCALTAASILTFLSGQMLLLVFIIYTIGNLCLLYASYKRGSSWFILMSIGFIILNIIGIANL